jgi:hypothetical protein
MTLLRAAQPFDPLATYSRIDFGQFFLSVDFQNWQREAPLQSEIIDGTFVL